MLNLLSRDLRQYFYPNFKRVLIILVDLIDPTNAALLEHLFTCLSYMFKFLQKQLVKELVSTFSYYKSILGHKKPFVRSFGAQSFSFLVRRLDQSELDKHLLYFFSQHEDPEIEETDLNSGLSDLFFELIKGSKGKLHSRAENILSMLFSTDLLSKEYVTKVEENQNSDTYFASATLKTINIERVEKRYKEIIIPAFQRISYFIHQSEAFNLWDWIRKSLSDRVSQYSQENVDKNLITINCIYFLDSLVTCFKSKKELFAIGLSSSSVYQENITKKRKRDKNVKKDLHDDKLPIEQICFSLVDLLKVFSKQTHTFQDDVNSQYYTSLLIEKFYSLLSFTLKRLSGEFLEQNTTHIQSLIFELPFLCNNKIIDVMTYLTDFWKANNEMLTSLPISNWFLHRMLRYYFFNFHFFFFFIFYLKRLMNEKVVSEDKRVIFLFKEFCDEINNVNISISFKEVSNIFTSALKTLQSFETQEKEVIWYSFRAILRISKYSGFKDSKQVTEIARKIFQHFYKKQENPIIFSLCLEVETLLSPPKDFFSSQNNFNNFIDLITHFSSDVFVVQSSEVFVNSLSAEKKKTPKNEILASKLLNENHEKIVKFLKNNLSSENNELRSSTLKLLISIFKFRDLKIFDKDKHAFEYCLMVEETSKNLLEIKRSSASLLHIPSIISRGSLESCYFDCIVEYLLGTFHIKISTVWPSSIDSLVEISKNNFNGVWNVLKPKILSLEKIAQEKCLSLKNKKKEEIIEEKQDVQEEIDSDFQQELQKYKVNSVKWESFYDSIWGKKKKLFFQKKNLFLLIRCCSWHCTYDQK